MRGKSAVGVVAAWALFLAAEQTARAQAAAEPPYVFVLRSRDAVVTPERTRYAETGGGFIQVTQIAPNVVLFLMRGAVAAGDDHSGRASLQFRLEQDLEIKATRAKLRPPRLVSAAWLIGSLDSALKHGGNAEQGAATASVTAPAGPVADIAINPHSASGGENLLVNERVGPLEACVLPGPFHLSQSFGINAFQAHCCHAGAAAAHFDPDPRLDNRWNEVLKPFRAVPKRDFGFRVILRVVEDVPSPDIVVAPPPVEGLPPPQPLPDTREQKPTPPIVSQENSDR